MACAITDGIDRGCRDNAGGVYEFYIATYPTVPSITKGGSDGEITDIDDDSTAVTFYKFIPNKTSSEFTETYQVSLENGTVGYEQKATMIFSKMEASKAAQVKVLATGTVMIIVKDKNSNYFLMGENEGAQLSGGNAGTGKALTDLNGYNLELTALEGDSACEVDSSAITSDASGDITVQTT